MVLILFRFHWRYHVPYQGVSIIPPLPNCFKSYNKYLQSSSSISIKNLKKKKEKKKVILFDLIYKLFSGKMSNNA